MFINFERQYEKMGDIVVFSTNVWMNFKRDSSNLSKRFLEYALEVPVYTQDEFEFYENKDNVVNILSSLDKVSYKEDFRYSPTSDIENIEYGKFNLLFDLYKKNIKPYCIGDFSIIKRPTHNSVILLADLYQRQRDL